MEDFLQNVIKECPGAGFKSVHSSGATIRNNAQEAYDLLCSQNNLLRTPSYELRAACFKSIKVCIESKKSKLLTLGLTGLAKIIRDERFQAGTEPEDDSLWMPAQLLHTTSSMLSQCDDTQVHILRCILSMACLSSWALNGRLVMLLIGRCGEAYENGTQPVRAAAQAAASQTLTAFCSFLDEECQEILQQQLKHKNSGSSAEMVYNKTSPVACFNEAIPVMQYICSKLEEMKTLPKSNDIIVYLLECLLTLVSTLPQTVHSNTHFTTFLWQKFCPSLLALLGTPGDVTQGLSTNQAKIVYSIGIQVVRLVGRERALRPVLESLFHRMLLLPSPSKRLEALKATKELLRSPGRLADLLLLSGPIYRHAGDDMAIIRLIMDSIEESAQHTTDMSLLLASVECVYALLTSLESLTKGEGLDHDGAELTHQRYHTLDQADYTGPLTYQSLARLPKPYRDVVANLKYENDSDSSGIEGGTTIDHDDDSSSSGATEGPEDLDLDDDDDSIMDDDAFLTNQQLEKLYNIPRSLHLGRSGIEGCNTDMERHNARHFVKTLQTILLPNLLQVRSSIQIDEFLQEFASKSCQQNSAHQNYDSTTITLMNADGIYLSTYSALILNLRLIHCGHYLQDSSHPEVNLMTESQFVEEVHGSGVLVYVSATWLCELYQNVIAKSLLEMAGYDPKSLNRPALINLLTDVGGLCPSHHLTDWMKLARVSCPGKEEASSEVEAGVKLARRVLTCCWQSVVAVLGSSLLRDGEGQSGGRAGRMKNFVGTGSKLRNKERLRDDVVSASFEGLQKAATLSNTLKLQARASSVLSLLSSSACNTHVAVIRLLPSHALSLDVLISKGLELAAHNAECWPHVFEACVAIASLEHSLFSQSGMGTQLMVAHQHVTNGREHITSSTIGSGIDEETIDIYSFLQNSSSFPTKFPLKKFSTNKNSRNANEDDGVEYRELTISEIINNSHFLSSSNSQNLTKTTKKALTNKKRDELLITGPQLAKISLLLSSKVDELFHNAATQLSLPVLLSFLIELCKSSKQQIYSNAENEKLEKNKKKWWNTKKNDETVTKTDELQFYSSSTNEKHDQGKQLLAGKYGNYDTKLEKNWLKMEYVHENYASTGEIPQALDKSAKTVTFAVNRTNLHTSNFRESSTATKKPNKIWWKSEYETNTEEIPPEFDTKLNANEKESIFAANSTKKPNKTKKRWWKHFKVDENKFSSGAESPLLLTRIVEVTLKIIKSGRPLIHIMKIWSVVGPHFITAACHPDAGIKKKSIQGIHDIITFLLNEHMELPLFHFNESLFKPYEHVILLDLLDQDLEDQIVTSLCQFVEGNPNEIGSGWRSLFGTLKKTRIQNQSLLDVFYIFIKNQDPLIFANAALDYILCLLGHVKGNDPKMGPECSKLLESCAEILGMMYRMPKCPRFNLTHRKDPGHLNMLDPGPRPDEEIVKFTVFNSAVENNVDYQLLLDPGFCISLSELDPKNTGCLKVWYVLLEGLTHLISTEENSGSLQLLIELYQRSLVNPGPNFTYFCLNHLLLPEMYLWLHKTSQNNLQATRCSSWIHFKHSFGVVTDLVTHSLRNTGSKSHPGQDLTLKNLIFLLIACLRVCNEQMTRLATSCWRHIVQTLGDHFTESQWEIMSLGIHWATALTLNTLHQITLAFSPHSYSYYGDLATVRVTQSTVRSSKVNQLAHKIFLGSMDPMDLFQNAFEYSFVLDPYNLRLPFINVITGILGHQILIQMVSGILLQNLTQVRPILKILELKEGSYQGINKHLTTKHVYTLLKCLDLSGQRAREFDLRPGLKFLTQKLGSLPWAANLYRQANTSDLIQLVVLIDLGLEGVDKYSITRGDLRYILTKSDPEILFTDLDHCEQFLRDLRRQWEHLCESYTVLTQNFDAVSENKETKKPGKLKRSDSLSSSDSCTSYLEDPKDPELSTDDETNQQAGRLVKYDTNTLLQMSLNLDSERESPGHLDFNPDTNTDLFYYSAEKTTEKCHAKWIKTDAESETMVEDHLKEDTHVEKGMVYYSPKGNLEKRQLQDIPERSSSLRNDIPRDPMATSQSALDRYEGNTNLHKKTESYQPGGRHSDAQNVKSDPKVSDQSNILQTKENYLFYDSPKEKSVKCTVDQYMEKHRSRSINKDNEVCKLTRIETMQACLELLGSLTSDKLGPLGPVLQDGTVMLAQSGDEKIKMAAENLLRNMNSEN